MVKSGRRTIGGNRDVATAGRRWGSGDVVSPPNEVWGGAPGAKHVFNQKNNRNERRKGVEIADPKWFSRFLGKKVGGGGEWGGWGGGGGGWWGGGWWGHFICCLPARKSGGAGQTPFLTD